MANEVTTRQDGLIAPSDTTQLDALASEDYDYGRSTMYEALETAQDLLTRAMRVAEESEAPHAITVANEVIKTIVNTSERLIELQNKFRTINQKSGGVGVSVNLQNGGQQNPQNAPVAIQMTTRELLSMIKEAKDERVINN